MITSSEFYHVLSNVAPLYAAMFLGYGSVKWLKIFNPDQCSGISLFVSKFAVPLLSFAFISTNNLYVMNYRFLAADTLQKIIVLVALAVWCRFSSRGSIEWCITLFSVTALPSIIVMGVPMLDNMYGHISDTLLVQTVVLQYLVWFPLLLFLLEYRAARISVSKKLYASNGSLTSIKVESGHLKSLNGTHEKDRRTLVRCLSAPLFTQNTTSAEYKDSGLNMSCNGSKPGENGAEHEGPTLTNSKSIIEMQPKGARPSESKTIATHPNRVKTKAILAVVGKKLLRNPNTYASVIGLAWSLIAFRYHVKLPTIIDGSIRILSDGAVGMAMFSLGLFMAFQKRFIACGKAAAAFTGAMRFVIGPAIMAAVSLALGLRGTILHIGIVQAALPLGIVTFVFARDYDVHPEIQSTGVSFGLIIALPITLVYYILLGL